MKFFSILTYRTRHFFREVLKFLDDFKNLDLLVALEGKLQDHHHAEHKQKRGQKERRKILKYAFIYMIKQIQFQSSYKRSLVLKTIIFTQ